MKKVPVSPKAEGNMAGDAATVLEHLLKTQVPAEDRTGYGDAALKAAAEAWQVDGTRFEAATSAAADRARSALEKHRFGLAGKRIFFFPDSQLEVPLARVLSRELGVEIERVVTLDKLTAQRDRLPKG